MVSENTRKVLNLDYDEERSRKLLLDHLKTSLDNDLDTVLVVDDSMTMRKLVTKLLDRSCPTLHVIEAINGEDALLKLRDRRRSGEPDPILIITDLEMPVMDGWELVEELGRDYRQKGLEQGIPIIVLSASTGEKGFILGKKSIQRLAKSYSPFVAVAKEDCARPKKYDAVGDRGLLTWVEYFMG